MRIIQAPGHGIEDSGNAILRHAASEERITLEGAKGIVLDLCMSGRCALTDEIQVNIGSDRRSVEEDEPYVDAQFRLVFKTQLDKCTV